MKVASYHLDSPFHLMTATLVSIKYDGIQEISVGQSISPFNRTQGWDRGHYTCTLQTASKSNLLSSCKCI